MRIYILGYMAAGKTTFGRQLAKQLKMDFADTDDYIESKYQLSINQLFKETGESNFRNIERGALEDLSLRDNVVIATGGGLPCFFDNMDYIKAHGTSIYLKASEEVLAERLNVVKASRPLLKDKSKEELQESIAKMLQEREPFYSQANIIVNADDEDRVVSMMVMALKYQ